MRSLRDCQRPPGWGMSAGAAVRQSETGASQEVLGQRRRMDSPPARLAVGEGCGRFCVYSDVVAKEAIGGHRQSLALTLRRLRLERGLSQSDLARATGISSSFLSLVEQGRSDITIGRLLRLAEFYDLEINDLLDGGAVASRHPVQVLRADRENMIHSATEGVDLFDLASGSRWTLVPRLGVHQPGSKVEIRHLHEHETMLFVLDGTFEIEVAGVEPVRLRRGEGAICRDVPAYSVSNVGKRTGRLLGINPRHRPLS